MQKVEAILKNIIEETVATEQQSTVNYVIGNGLESTETRANIAFPKDITYKLMREKDIPLKKFNLDHYMGSIVQNAMVHQGYVQSQRFWGIPANTFLFEGISVHVGSREQKDVYTLHLIFH